MSGCAVDDDRLSRGHILLCKVIEATPPETKFADSWLIQLPDTQPQLSDSRSDTSDGQFTTSSFPHPSPSASTSPPSSNPFPVPTHLHLSLRGVPDSPRSGLCGHGEFLRFRPSGLRTLRGCARVCCLCYRRVRLRRVSGNGTVIMRTDGA